ncbi:MAG: chromosome partitioning protein ParB, partial [Gammaproteobacteria bacterium]|nr:chromosome partitioning protein ParB [Gammaproteobacteria bacterium]
ARHVNEKGLSVRATEAYVRNYGKSKAGKKKTKITKDPNITRLEQEISESLGATVSIRHNKGKGAVEIRYHSLDELQGILDKIRK